MIATTHLIASAAITAYCLKNGVKPLRAITYGFTSHICLDLILHAEESDVGGSFTEFGTPANIAAVIDNLVGFGVLFWLVYILPWLRTKLTILITLASWGPDVVETGIKMLKLNFWLAQIWMKAHEALHFWKPLPDYPRIEIGIITTIAVTFFLLRYLRLEYLRRVDEEKTQERFRAHIQEIYS